MAETLWSSERLYFRGVNDSDAKFLVASLSDPQTHVQLDPFLHTPPATKKGAESVKWMSEQLLAAIICLKEPPPSTPATTTATNGDAGVAAAATPAAEDDLHSADLKLTRIGHIVLMSGPPGQAHHRNAQIGLGLLKPYHGKGYGTEALEWVLRWGFRMANLHRITIAGFGLNPGAKRLYERVGFVQEGVQREEMWYDGRYWDSWSLSMLDREWYARYGEKETRVLAGAESVQP
ncbi:acyl-CoA N-acyltransferase [Neohortaea acidophila]|uniref:Acyl-CoA N-acyltransferase n=1 Tax=Neohortaea acidophila TaxID=245834 RepID=A0A6A6Q1L2_9PEZI|nr:acyl-CoA N-acyltransferase [Neohortaea acidophila]KAF2485869.1 acyl-CoA N-acyltransferase [Neohortaea acidophila]